MSPELAGIAFAIAVAIILVGFSFSPEKEASMSFRKILANERDADGNLKWWFEVPTIEAAVARAEVNGARDLADWLRKNTDPQPGQQTVLDKYTIMVKGKGNGRA